MKRDRETALHRWIADGKVEFREVRKVTEYRVVGTKEWWSDRKDLANFPTVKLIATLALGVASLQPDVKPIIPQWQHAWKACPLIEGFDV